jgi:ribosomal protein L12E/L44/L45/RPP1/RPP2
MSDALLREWRGDPPRDVRVNVFSKNDHKISLEHMQLVMTQNGLDATGAKIDLQRRFLAHKQAAEATRKQAVATAAAALATAAAALATADGFLD